MKSHNVAVLDSVAFRHSIAASQLRCPTDLQLASRLHRANCGPAAYAATFERNVLEVMECFPQFPRKPYTTCAQMISAFSKSGHVVRKVNGLWPVDGVALLQFLGPWGNEKSPSSAALRYTHWVGVKRDLIYDLNWGAWLPLLSWEALVYPMFTDFEPKISGWKVRCGLQIENSNLGHTPTQFAQASELHLRGMQEL